MKTYQKVLLLLSLAGLIIACSTTTQIRKSWSDPSLAKNPVEPFKKVFVQINVKNALSKKTAEDLLVEQLRNVNAIPSYAYVTSADTSQKELVEKLIKDGFDGAITMRVKSVVQTETKKSNPGTSYASWSNYGYSYSYTVDLSDRNSSSNIDVKSPKDYIVETNIYSLTSKKLLWSGVTASISATKIDPMITGIVTTIRNELHKKGFVKD